MTSLRRLTKKEIDSLLQDVKYQKSEIKKFLESQIKVYKLSVTELKQIKKIINQISSENSPRYLKEKEIDEILKIIPESPCCISDIAKFNRQKVLEKIKHQIQGYKVCPDKKSLEKFKSRLYESYIRSLCDAGESVGSNGANSIGQLLTQMSLNTFHTSGSQNSSNLKSIEELFNMSVTRNSNSCTVHFRDKDLTKEEIFRNYNQKLKGITVENLINFTEILEDLTDEEETWLKNYEKIKRKKIERSKAFLRIHINVYKCFLYDISIFDIVSIIQKTTKSRDNKNSLTCVPTSTFKGIIDIYSDEIFIRKSVEEFSTKGKSFKGCGKKYFKTTKNYNDDENQQKTFIKTPINTNGELKDLSTIFLTVILQSCFKEMKIIGIKGLENTSTITLNLISFTKTIKVFHEKDIEKFSRSPFELTASGFDRLYYIYVDYNCLNIIGIPGSKFINFFESSGMKILESNFSNHSPYCIVLVPEVSDEIFEGAPRFKKIRGKIVDNKDKNSFYKIEEPVKLMSRKLRESEELLKKNVKLNLVNSDFSSSLEFPEIYRYGYYNYIKAFGLNIFTKIIKNKLIDSKYSMSDNVIDINKYFGIEASRFYLIKEYTSNDNIKKLNHVNIELLVDFQTTMGHLLSVTSTDISKHSGSALSAAAFEQPMAAFQKAGSIGNNDIINNISSCLMTGKECKNGTGKAFVTYDDGYIENPDNKLVVERNNEIKFEDVDQKEILGSCFAPGKYVEETFKDEEDEDEEAMGEKVFKPEIINSNVKNKRKNALNIINKKETKGREKIKEEKEEDEIESDLDLDINDDIDIDEETLFDL